MRHLWKSVSAHRHGESFAIATPDLTVLRRHLHSLRKRGLLERAGLLVEACGRNNGATKRSCRTVQFARVATLEMESEEHRFCVCEGNGEGDPDLLDIVAKTDWILPEALEGLMKLALRSFSCVAWHQDLGCWRRPTRGQR